MKGDLGDKVRIQHIYDAVIEIESYIQDASYDTFQSNLMMQRACINLLEIIGEAANHLSSWLKKVHNEIEWQEVVDLRNILIHEYFGIDTKIVWDIIQHDIPKMKIQIQEILKQI
jgi:uncharacterized protein with HEPN domain